MSPFRGRSFTSAGAWERHANTVATADAGVQQRHDDGGKGGDEHHREQRLEGRHAEQRRPDRVAAYEAHGRREREGEVRDQQRQPGRDDQAPHGGSCEADQHRNAGADDDTGPHQSASREPA